MDKTISRLLEANRHQRHDFLNHLQVVWGFIKLNKPLKAVEYIEEVTEYIQGLKELNNIECNQAGALLSSFILQIGKTSNFIIDIPDKCLEPSTTSPLLEALEELFFLLLPDIDLKSIRVKLTIINGQVVLEVQTLLAGHNINWVPFLHTLKEKDIDFYCEDEGRYFRLLIRY